MSRKFRTWIGIVLAAACVFADGSTSPVARFEGGAEASSRVSRWRPASPGGGGSFESAGAGPTGTILACSDVSGGFVSTDRGGSWDAAGFNRGLTTTHCSAVGFDREDADILYFGTDDGIFRSKDEGATFEQVMTAGFVTDIEFSDREPTVGYAAVHPRFDSGKGSIYGTIDRGEEWDRVSGPLPGNFRILKLLLDPSNTETLYLVTGRDRFFERGRERFYASRDGGRSWQRMAASLGDIWDATIDPGDPDTLYVTAYEDLPGRDWRGGVYRSTDGGDSWDRLVDRTGAIVVKRDDPQVLRVIDVDRLYFEEQAGVWESTDGGATWAKKSEKASWDTGWQEFGLVYTSPFSGVAKTLGEDLSDPETILWVDTQFVWASFDGGASFENLYTKRSKKDRWKSRGIHNTNMMSLEISEARPKNIYLGHYDIGCWRSKNGGKTWQSCNHPEYTGGWEGAGGDVQSILADPQRKNVVWIASGENGSPTTLLRSDRAGARDSWVVSDMNLQTGVTMGLSLDRSSPRNRRTLFAVSANDVFRSHDDGERWARALVCGGCRETAVDFEDGRIVYAGGEAGLFRSLQGGDPGTWDRVGPGAFSGQRNGGPWGGQWTGVHDIAPDPKRTARVYVAAYGNGGGLYRSDDSGDTWTRLLAEPFLRRIAVDPKKTSVLYVTSSEAWEAGGDPFSGSRGVLRSTDGGATWEEVNEGLAWPFAGPIAIHPKKTSTVLVGSPGTGFHKRKF